jgi:hypothetical protein
MKNWVLSYFVEFNGQNAQFMRNDGTCRVIIKANRIGYCGWKCMYSQIEIRDMKITSSPKSEICNNSRGYSPINQNEKVSIINDHFIH